MPLCPPYSLALLTHPIQSAVYVNSYQFSLISTHFSISSSLTRTYCSSFCLYSVSTTFAPISFQQLCSIVLNGNNPGEANGLLKGCSQLLNVAVRLPTITTKYVNITLASVAPLHAGPPQTRTIILFTSVKLCLEPHRSFYCNSLKQHSGEVLESPPPPHLYASTCTHFHVSGFLNAEILMWMRGKGALSHLHQHVSMWSTGNVSTFWFLLLFKCWWRTTFHTWKHLENVLPRIYKPFYKQVFFNDLTNLMAQNWKKEPTFTHFCRMLIVSWVGDEKLDTQPSKYVIYYNNNIYYYIWYI